MTRKSGILAGVAAGTLWAQSIRFADVTPGSGIEFRNAPSRTPEKYLIESMTGGVALLDFDGDGLLDVYFANGAALGSPMPAGARPAKDDPAHWNRLYRNLGRFRFEDVTERAGVRGSGYSMGAAAADFDGDGRADLLVTGLGGNALYRNTGGGVFEDVTAKAGVAGSGWTTGAAFLDYDKDGDLDLFIARYVEWSFERNPYCGERKAGMRAYCHPDQFAPAPHLLYRNNGKGVFEDVSTASGIAKAKGKGLGVIVGDTDGDGRPDIVVANDSFPQQLFHNRGDGTFEETGLGQGMAYDDDGHTFAGMGIDLADIDNDGWPDLFINALANQRYALFRNLKGLFEYASGPAGVGRATMAHSGWGARLADLDNDGWRDLFVAQGHVMDNIERTQPGVKYLEPPLVMRNTRGVFTDVSPGAGPVFTRPLAARGAAFGDLDNDGAVDAVLNCNDQPALVLRNQSQAGHWVMVRLEGGAGNRDGVGAVVRVVTAAGAQQAMASPAGSYLSSNDPRLHFGLGASTEIRLIEVRWPSGSVSRVEKPAADTVIRVKE